MLVIVFGRLLPGIEGSLQGILDAPRSDVMEIKAVTCGAFPECRCLDVVVRSGSG
nr:hypothetical protein [Nitrosomonas supralitoralis]